MTQRSLFDDFEDKSQEEQQELKDWHGNPVPISPNPMVRLYGAMEGKKCKDCKHLFKELYRSASYLKCDLRKLTRGPGSDHRAKWQACKRFEEDQGS